MIVDLQTALQFLGITNPTPEQEASITLYIELVGAEIEDYLGTVIVQREITDEIIALDRNDDYSIVPKIDIRSGYGSVGLAYSPVADVVLTDNGSTVASSQYEVNSGSGVIWLGFYPKGELTATYKAGYDPVPKSLQLVALQGVRQYYSAGAVVAGSGNIKSKSLDRFSVTYAGDNTLYGDIDGKQYLNGNAGILDRYRNWRIWG